MNTRWTRNLVALAAAVAASAAWADLTIGASLPLTGPASGLGIPMNNGFKLWPQTIAGEKVNLIVLDDATDPTKGLQNARRFASADKADLIVGSGATPVAIPMAEVATETKTVHLSLAPIPLPAGKDAWSFRLPHSNGVMANAMLAHMHKAGVKTVGFLGYNDAYGESWLQELGPRLDKAGIKLVATERFARADTSATSQALKLNAARPDAVIVVASGSGAAMPHLALVERGYKGRIYQTHAAATRDLMRVGGRGVEGGFVSAGPLMAAEQLPDSHPTKPVALKFVQAYEKQFGPGTRTTLAGHTYDMYLLLEQVVPVALKKARPGTPEFRAALKEALETAPALALSNGMLRYTATDHWGFQPDAGVILKVVGGEWKLDL
ncbi:ABC transporter substrate-binding protein [Azohydromonas caseinilytica]|uniref:ABC transporter substrate-binding protein n=1 Tax=Azohydromonas caseinilytica TaxID=2728836 RepID=A0A848FM36_9BURK|nr:ABC transporter substrate-binding protein [Azohydromonas caseinilytica]NML18841.1 ABC transporter substrate-binding protein [Azohydromonas caseinilytica]